MFSECSAPELVVMFADIHKNLTDHNTLQLFLRYGARGVIISNGTAVMTQPQDVYYPELQGLSNTVHTSPEGMGWDWKGWNGKRR